MARRSSGKRAPAARKDATANLGFEAKLWLAADKSRKDDDVRSQFGFPPNANFPSVPYFNVDFLF